MSTIAVNPPPTSPLPPLPPSTIQPIISSNRYNNYLYQQHYMPYNYHNNIYYNNNNNNNNNNNYYNNYTNHITQQYSTDQISCPGKLKCPDEDCLYGHAGPFDREKGQQLFCERIGDCPYGNNCSRYHIITWNINQPPKELKCPYYYNRKHPGYCKGFKVGKCPYYHGRVDKINNKQPSHNYEHKNQSESRARVSTNNYCLYSHGWRCIDKTPYESAEEVNVTMNKSYVVVYRNKIIMKNKLDFWKKHHWFYMCIGEAIFDKLLQLPIINHYCIVWHKKCQCWSDEFGANDFGKCLQKYDELKGCARAIISNGKPIKQTILKNGKYEVDNEMNEWLKAAFGYYYCQFMSD
eukprot:59914_1